MAPSPVPAGSPGLVAGAAIRANPHSAAPHVLLALGATRDGGYALAWSDRASNMPTVHQQHFDAQGWPAGAELMVPVPDLVPGSSAVAVLPDGDLVLACAHLAEPSSEVVRTSIGVKRYDTAALQLGPSREVAAVVQSRAGGPAQRSLDAPSLVRWDDGRFLLGWLLVEPDMQGGLVQVWTQRFDPAGAPVNGPVLAGRGDSGTGYRIDAAPASGYLLTTYSRMMGRTYLRYTAWNGAVAPALPPGALGAPEGSLLLPVAGGRNVLVSPALPGASLQLFAPDGQPMGPAGALQAMPMLLAGLHDTSWVAFTATRSGTLQAQRFGADGVRIGRAFAVAAPGARPQTAALIGGGLALAWTGRGDAEVMTQVLQP